MCGSSEWEGIGTCVRIKYFLHPILLSSSQKTYLLFCTDFPLVSHIFPKFSFSTESITRAVFIIHEQRLLTHLFLSATHSSPTYPLHNCIHLFTFTRTLLFSHGLVTVSSILLYTRCSCSTFHVVLRSSYSRILKVMNFLALLRVL